MWVFLATILTSTVLIPIMAGLFWRGRKTKLAGLLGCAFGLVGSILFYLGLYLFGAENEEFGTYILDFTVGGVDFSLWQEYALFFSLPLSFLGFILGNLLGSDVQEPPPAEVRA